LRRYSFTAVKEPSGPKGEPLPEIPRKNG